MTTQDYWILNNGFIKFITHLKGWEEDDESYDKFYEMYNPEDWGPLNGFEDNRNEVSAVETNCGDCNEWVTSTEECCGGDESEEDKLDIKVLGFKTTDRLDGDWNSLLFEIRNQEIIVGI